MRCQGVNLQDEIDGIDVSIILTDTGTIGRYTLIKDGHGGRTASWVPAATTVPCSVEDIKPAQPTRLGERLRDAAMSQKIKVGRTTFLNQKDRITINSVVYDIQGESERASLGLFNIYYGQIVTDPHEVTL